MADGRFLDTLVVTRNLCWAGMEDMNTHHHLLATKTYNYVVTAHIRLYGGSYKPQLWMTVPPQPLLLRTIVIRHKKTWARMVPVQNNVSLVHDDGF
jgi:hypothetical protein